MAEMTFRRATKKQSRLRMAIDGPSGSGKTFTSLIAAFVIAGEGGRVAVIDTERGSASKYADRFPEFDTLELETFSPQTYTEAIKIAGEAGYDVLIIDSLSHAWEGEGGALDQVDKMASRGGGNSYTAWKDVTPMHRRMVDAILQSPCHVIATMRSKMEYVLEADSKGRMVPRKVGLSPIQRQGTEYEFDIVADMDINHKLTVSKSRAPVMDGLEEVKPNARWFAPLRAWLMDGTAAEQAPPTFEPATPPAESVPWGAAEQSRFRELVTFSGPMGGMGLSKDELLRLVPEVVSPKSYGAYAVLGSVDEAVALVKERLAQELSKAGDANG